MVFYLFVLLVYYNYILFIYLYVTTVHICGAVLYFNGWAVCVCGDLIRMGVELRSG